jgi:hypothetical protein
VVLLAVFLIRLAIENSQTAQETVEGQVATEEAKCQDARDVEKCLNGVPTSLARSNGSSVYCQDNEGDERDRCLLAAALAANDREICAEIVSETASAACLDSILVRLARESGQSFELCGQYTNVALQQTCVDDLLYAQAWAGDCSDERISALMCRSLAATKAAQEARDPGLCDVIEDVYYVDACRELVGSGDLDLDGISADEEAFRGTSDNNSDSDGDGLTDFDEINAYHTDPAAADTDRDGFDDGTEVKSGYDPLR